MHASLVTQSDSRSRATLARPPRREKEAARDVSVRAVPPAQGERARLVAASTLSAVPGQRVGEQALLASRRRPARSEAAQRDGRLTARFDRATRSALEPALHEDLGGPVATQRCRGRSGLPLLEIMQPYEVEVPRIFEDDGGGSCRGAEHGQW